MRNKLKKFFLKSKFSKIKCLVLDVDGVLTDGDIFIDNENRILKKFSVKDGMALKLLQDNDIQIIFLSGGSGQSTENRAIQLGISHCYVNIKNKSQCLRNIQKELGFDSGSTAYVGDDLNDLPLRNAVDLLISPNDACKEMKKISDLVLNNNGGKGAVREVCEIILKSKGLWVKYSKTGFIDKND